MPRPGRRKDPRDSVEPFEPFEPGSIPPSRQWPLALNLLQGLAAAAEFRALDDTAPLLLLPVRLETKYVMNPAPGELRIRIFPEPVHVDAGDDDRPATAALLPRRWVALGYHGSDLLFAEVSRAVAPSLATSLDPADASWQVEASGLKISPALAWMFDYDRAVDAGMAITIPLGDGDRLLAEISTLLVVGVDSSMTADEAAAELTRIIEGHERHAGFAFVPQGTPTNNTAGVAAGWTRAERERADLADPADPLKLGDPVRPGDRARPGGSARPGDPVQPGDPVDPAPVRTPGTNAARFSRALGLHRPNVAERVAFGDDPERARSRAMNTVLYQTLFGRLVTSVLSVGDQAQPVEITQTWRRWLIDRVTGGAPLPTVRVGSHPYGILPVRTLGRSDRQTAAGNVEATVQYLRGAWRAAVPNVPTLDPDATDLAGDEADPLDAVAAVLASQPHPARIFSRQLQRDGEGLSFLFESVRVYRAVLTAIETQLPTLWDLYQGAIAGHGPFTDIHDQLAFWHDMHDVIDNAEYGIEQGHPTEETEKAMHDRVDAVIEVVDNWLDQQDPIEVVGLPVYNGVVGDPLTGLVGGHYASESFEWTTPHLVAAPEAPENEQPAAYLRVLATRVTQPTVASSFPDEAAARAPMLHQLIEGALGQLAQHPTASIEALRTLAELDTAHLERLLRESLGLATHRLDAWATSLASARLDEMRDARPTGVNVGAYGWVVNLARGPASDSEGFIHAPSLEHASTAAVLRSAWQAHGHDDAVSPAAVNLDSRRVRTADWLVQGLHAGLPLAELLGQRFERGLHDRHLDDQIDDIRRAVLDADPSRGATIRDPIDGVRLLELWRDGSLEPYLTSSGALRSRMEAELADLDAVYDALADATLFESTHHLVNGNLDAAAAVLTALSTGTPVLPELRASRTGRGGTTVEHRVAIVVPAGPAVTESGWVSGLRDRFAAGLERWVRGLLPDPGRVGLVATAPGGTPIALKLSGLGLSALDLIDLAGPQPSVLAPALAGLIAAHHRLGPDLVLDASRRGDAEIALEELLLVASELRSAFAGARPLRPTDLQSAGAPASGDPDVTSLALAMERTVGAFSAAVGTSSSAADTVVLARFGRVLTPGDEASWRPLRTMADGLAAAPVGGIGLDELTRRAAALFGAAVPVVPSYPLPVPAPPDSALGGGLTLDAGLAGAEVVDDWLEAVGRVRPAVGRLVTAAMLAELLGGPPVTWTPGQNGIANGGGWVAVGHPGGRLGGWTSVCAAMPPGEKAVPGTPVSGLLLDRWSERIPKADRITGVTFHFDAPNARAPQAWILALPPRGAQWTLKLVVDTLFEVGDWSRLRTVQPEDLVAYGHAIPTAFAPGLLRVPPGTKPVA
jgi:hypothetical protein